MSEPRKTRKLLGWILVPLLVVAAAATWFAVDPAFRLERSAPDGATALPKDEFEQRVRDYILNNPEVIMEAARRFEQRQRAAAEGEATSVLKSRADEIFRDAGSPVGGNPGGDVTLVEFFDYNCPYCRKVAPVMSEAESADPQLRVVYKEFPILGPNSSYAAKAALAVHKQGKYLAFHRELMQGRGTVDTSRVIEAAGKVGVDVERMKSDMNDPAIAAAIERNLALAQVLRIDGTPGFVIGEKILRGATDLKTMQGLIRDARASRG
ncbi:MAG: DsbA family protein [Pseudorhodoplanes sp.]|nr:DsbA family protein [Pseudorhodoplanes sp.]